MDLLPEQGDFICDCPHSLQKYLGCNDDSARRIAGLVFAFATDYKQRVALAKDEKAVEMDGTFRRLLNALLEYDVAARPTAGDIFLYRYERPITPAEMQTGEAVLDYFRNAQYDSVRIPVKIADITRAFGEFAGEEIPADVIENCLGFYDDPAAGADCDCGKNWERTWDK